MNEMNFVIMKTMFGDYWVGKTNLEVNDVGIFATFDEAIGHAMDLNDSIENLEELQNAIEEEVEEVEKESEKWIVT